MINRRYLVVLLLSLLLIVSACSDSSKEITIDKGELEDTLPEDCVKIEREVGLDIAFVLDSSGSMEKNDAENLRVKDSKLIVDEMKEDDRALVISFDKESHLLTEAITMDKNQIINALDQIPSDRKYTNLGAGLNMAINEFEKNKSSNQKVIIALTDGENTGEDTNSAEKIDQDTYNQALIASNNNITIYTIGLGKDLDTELLGTIASTTGGKYFHAEDNFGLKEVYRNVVEEMKCLPVEKNEENNKYVIFEDENLKQLINEALGQATNYSPTEKDLAEITAITSSELKENIIQSLKGLEYAINLKSIDFSNQKINDLSPIIKLTTLEDLKINNNNLGLLNLLTAEEKKLYANYLVEEQNAATTELNLVDGKILDSNKDDKLDLVLVYNEQCENISFEANCIYIEILTIADGKVKVLYNTKEYSNDGQALILETGGGAAYNSVYINNTKSNFEVIISTSGGGRINHREFYQYITLDKNKNFSYSVTTLYASYCSPGDDDCEDISSVDKIKGNIDLESILAIIEKTKIVIHIDDEVSNENLLFNQLYEFATKKLVAKGGDFIRSPEVRRLLQDHNFVKSNINYNDLFQEAVAKANIIEQKVRESGYSGSSCLVYFTFEICNSEYSEIEGEITGVLIYPKNLTVIDLESALGYGINYEYSYEGTDMGYFYDFESYGQRYTISFQDDSTNASIERIVIF